MKERGIPFMAPMVRGVIEDRKVQTRRIVKPQPDGWYCQTTSPPKHIPMSGTKLLHCPYGVPGDRLWVREAWRAPSWCDDKSPIEMPTNSAVSYIADGGHQLNGRYRHARFMPRWASRLLLEVTAVRVERLQDISKADAIAEGVTQRGKNFCMDWSPVGQPIKGVRKADGSPALCNDNFIANDHPVGAFATYFESLHGQNAWADNPWVWVVEFKRIQP